MNRQRPLYSLVTLCLLLVCQLLLCAGSMSTVSETRHSQGDMGGEMAMQCLSQAEQCKADTPGLKVSDSPAAEKLFMLFVLPLLALLLVRAGQLQRRIARGRDGPRYNYPRLHLQHSVFLN